MSWDAQLVRWTPSDLWALHVLAELLREARAVAVAAGDVELARWCADEWLVASEAAAQSMAVWR